MDIEVSVAVPGRARVGEGPYWDSDQGRLHWVDIARGRIHSSTVEATDQQLIQLPTLVGAAVPKLSGGRRRPKDSPRWATTAPGRPEST